MAISMIQGTFWSNKRNIIDYCFFRTEVLS
jgi:hypothetical protein